MATIIKRLNNHIADHITKLESIGYIPSNWHWHKDRVLKLERVSEELINDLLDFHENHPEVYTDDITSELDKLKRLLEEMMREHDIPLKKQQEDIALIVNKLIEGIEMLSKKSVALSESMDYRKSRFLIKLANNPGFSALQEAIIEKRREYSTERNEEMESIFSSIIKLGVPILRDIDKDNAQMLKYCEDINDAIKKLPSCYKSEINAIVTKFDLHTGYGYTSGMEDFSIGLGLDQPSLIKYRAPEEITGAIIHELTHLKHAISLLFQFDEFQRRINNINARFQNKIKFKKEKIAGIPVYFERKEREEETLKDGLIITEKFFMGSNIAIQKMVIVFGNMEKSRTYIGTEEDNLIDIFEISNEDLRKLLKPFIVTEGVFITPYAASEKKIFDNIGEELNINIPKHRFELMSEDITEIADAYYSKKDYFNKVLFESKKGGYLRSLADSLDSEAKNPLLREKVRLLIEFGYLPEI